MLNEQQMRFAVVHKAHRFGIEPQQVFQLWAHEHAPQHSRGQVIAGKGAFAGAYLVRMRRLGAESPQVF
jgi:hypothetical protein